MSSYVFIDSRVPDFDSLLAGLASDVQVVVLDPALDGVTQIAQALEGVTDLDAIHIISHGSEGALYLGDTVLASDNLDHYLSELATIGASLTKEGDIVLYGCEVAKGTAGQNFIENLSLYTAADVAASTDTTGSSTLNGDWVLEAGSGSIESSGLFDEQTPFDALLDIIFDPIVLGPPTVLITGTPGDDALVGGDFENNYVQYVYPRDNYTVTVFLSSFAVANNAIVTGPEGTDTLANIERIQFPDDGLDLGGWSDPLVGQSYVPGGIIETVVASINYTLAVGMKNLELVAGVSNLTGAGNDLDNQVTGNDGDNVLSGGLGLDIIFGGAGNDIIDGGLGNDVRLQGGEGADTIYGGEGNDWIEGETGNDPFVGVAGNDALHGDNGDDIILAGGGDDLVYGGSGTDFLIGETGNDLAYGGSEWDAIDGRQGSDVLYGEGGADIIFGDGYFYLFGFSNDSLFGGADNDIMMGEAGENSTSGSGDAIYGEDGNDLLDGGGGDDAIYGGNGNDVIDGDHGNDYIVGGQGTDIMLGSNAVAYGGPTQGSDLFVYQAMTDAGDSIYGFDTRPGENDGIDLRPLFDALGYTGTTPRAAGYLYVFQNGTNADVYVDGDGAANGINLNVLLFSLADTVASSVTDSYFLFQ